MLLLLLRCEKRGKLENASLQFAADNASESRAAISFPFTHISHMTKGTMTWKGDKQWMEAKRIDWYPKGKAKLIKKARELCSWLISGQFGVILAYLEGFKFFMESKQYR